MSPQNNGGGSTRTATDGGDAIQQRDLCNLPLIGIMIVSG